MAKEDIGERRRKGRLVSGRESLTFYRELRQRKGQKRMGMIRDRLVRFGNRRDRQGVAKTKVLVPRGAKDKRSDIN